MSQMVQSSSGPAPQDMAREQFMNHFDDFMKALSDVFPNDDCLRDYYLKYKVAIMTSNDPAEKKRNETMIIDKFRTEASDKFDRMVARDVTVVKELTFIDWFAPLFEQADEETRSIIWDYCDLLIQHCVCHDMYTKIPPNVSSVLGNISQSVERGETDPSKLDVANLSAQILQNVNPAEMQEFALKMMSDEVAMRNLCRIAAGQMQKNMPTGPATGTVAGQPIDTATDTSTDTATDTATDTTDTATDTTNTDANT